jgi:methylmalonyl-CoA/ethylmalonyl-CoA epimerase
MIGKLHQVMLPVSDLERSVAFYRDVLGARLIARFEPPGLAFFQLGGVRLLLEHASSEARSGGCLYFDVPDIHSACAVLEERGVALDSPAHLIHRDDAGVFGPPGTEEWMAFFRDPDGNTLALACRVAPTRPDRSR